MKVSDVLLLPSLRGSTLAAGKNGLLSEVTGVMVLEAPDIEKWGKKGQVILSSFYALKDLDAAALDQFLAKLSTLEISALVIKLERLVSDIPSAMISYCEAHDLPLIQLGGEARYEYIIQEILEPLFKENARLLGNNAMYELLHSSSGRIAELLHILSIDQYPLYQLLIVQSESPLPNSYIDELLQITKRPHLSRAYLRESNRLIILFNFKDADRFHWQDLLPRAPFCQLALSSVSNVSEISAPISALLQQAEESLRIASLFYEQGALVFYDDLGFYHFLLSANMLDLPESWMPSWIRSLQKEHPVLLETLFLFIDNEKSYARTAEIMHLHPKSVKYRIDKVIDLTKIDLSSGETILQLMIAHRIYRLLQERIKR